jgi:type IV secretory pathway VirB2 component (pilin)
MNLSPAWQKHFRALQDSKVIFLLLLLLPVAAHAQAAGSPFDTGFTALQTLFTGTIAKVASLIAIVIGGYGFAHGEPGAKKALAGVAVFRENVKNNELAVNPLGLTIVRFRADQAFS